MRYKAPKLVRAVNQFCRFSQCIGSVTLKIKHFHYKKSAFFGWKYPKNLCFHFWDNITAVNVCTYKLWYKVPSIQQPICIINGFCTPDTVTFGQANVRFNKSSLWRTVFVLPQRPLYWQCTVCIICWSKHTWWYSATHASIKSLVVQGHAGMCYFLSDFCSHVKGWIPLPCAHSILLVVMFWADDQSWYCST